MTPDESDVQTLIAEVRRLQRQTKDEAIAYAALARSYEALKETLAQCIRDAGCPESPQGEYYGCEVVGRTCGVCVALKKLEGK